MSQLERCVLCPRECGVNRDGGQRGRCGVTAELQVARAALHMWEEPCVSGQEGSGAVFFSGCSLGCVFCQNQEISRGQAGRLIDVARLAEIFLELQSAGANNINLVTAAHYVPQVCSALREAKARGLRVPIVYNSSGYEKAKTLRTLEGLVDIYLPDFKYLDPVLAGRYSNAPDYPEAAKKALAEMVRQQGTPEFDSRGMMTRGVIVRHLLLPGHVREAKRVVRYLYETYGDRIYISMMNQYTPMSEAQSGGSPRQGEPAVLADPNLNRRVTKREYGRLLDYAAELGIVNGFYQEGETAMESFIPPFDCQGVLREGERDGES